MPANPLPGLEDGLVQEIAFDLYDAVGTRDRLPPAQTEARNAAAFVMLNALAPADPLQAMLASQAVALHYAAMACFRRACETETAPDPQTPRLHHSAVRLINAFAATIQRLHALQAPAQQPPAGEHPMHRETTPVRGQSIGQDPMQREASHSHFTSVFRRHFGLTPSAFRLECSNPPSPLRSLRLCGESFTARG
jgi:hypothetical protein